MSSHAASLVFGRRAFLGASLAAGAAALAGADPQLARGPRRLVLEEGGSAEAARGYLQVAAQRGSKLAQEELERLG